MKPSLFLSLFLFFLLHQSYTHAATLEETCLRVLSVTKIDPYFCVNTLKANPKSEKASPQELAIISTELSHQNATSTYCKIEDLLEKTTDRTLKKCLNSCKDSYTDVVADLKNTIPYIRHGPYDYATTLLNYAVGNPRDCQAAFGKTGYDNPLEQDDLTLDLLITMSTALASFLE